jgi:hypothetical protein
MEPLSVVLYQNDPGTAQSLAVGLSQHFESVHLAGTYKEIGPAIALHNAGAVVLDLETSAPDEVNRLHHESLDVRLNLALTGVTLGIARITAKDSYLQSRMRWPAPKCALNLGASDICEPRRDEVVRSVLHHLLRRAAA